MTNECKKVAPRTAVMLALQQISLELGYYRKNETFLFAITAAAAACENTNDFSLDYRLGP